jgi:N-methylhydantoinase B
VDPAGDRFVCYDLVIGGTGAGAGREGAQAVVGPHNPRNIPVEVLEATSPVRVERFGFVPDTGGAGEHRGASAVRKDIRVFGSRLKLHNLAERHTYPGFGLAGGAPGATGRITRLGAEPEALASKGSYRLTDGDLVAFQTPGAGGYGDPLRRDPAAVLADVRAGHLTPAGAERDHGVVLTPDARTVDEVATARLRAAIPARPAAGEKEVPA